MECTNIYNIREMLKKIAIAELKSAVVAHGGEYSWEDSNDMFEIVTRDEYVASLTVQRVTIENDALHIYAYDSDTGHSMDVCLDDIEAQDILFIVENIEPTETMQSTSIANVQEEADLCCEHLKQILNGR